MIYQILGGATSRLPNLHSHEQRRNALSIHEYDAMGLLKKFDIQTPKFTVASTPEEVFTIAKELGKIAIKLGQIATELGKTAKNWVI